MSELFENDPAVVLDRLRALRAADAPTHGGHVLSYVYDAGVAALDELAAAAQRLAMPVNGLDPTAFPSVAAMERDLVLLGRELLAGGDPDVVGTVTSGGTESCLLAVKSARDAWRARGGQGTPRLVIATTAHAAFHKAAHLFAVEPVVVPVDPVGLTPDPAQVAAAVDSSTCLVVVSAPSYPYGVLDPIADVAAMAADRGTACHVDACTGGWVLPFVADAPPYDLRVPGVTSLSVDLHKYGYAPKGASLLLHRDRDHARFQPFALTGWPGYAVVNPTLLGSRPGAPLASAWAIATALGRSGYARLAEAALDATTAVADAVADIDGLRVVAPPATTLLALAADPARAVAEQVDPHLLADAARRRGWLLQPQPRFRQADGTVLPRTVHLTVTAVTHEVVDELTTVLRDSADEVRGRPAAEPDPALVAAADQLDPAALDAAGAGALLEVAGLPTGGSLPAEMAPVMALLGQLPPAVAERLLVEYVSRLSEP